MLGGPLGAALGAALGHQFDKGLGKLDGVVQIEFPEVGDQQRVQTAFFTATFSVMGYMAKVDGHVAPSEIAMAENVMGHMQLSRAQKGAAIKLFNVGKEPGFPIDAALEQLRSGAILSRLVNEVEPPGLEMIGQLALEVREMVATADDREVARKVLSSKGVGKSYVVETVLPPIETDRRGQRGP